MAKDSLFIKHILEAIANIEEFLHEVNHDKFISDKLIQSAVVRQIEIVGEATKNLSVELREQNKGVPWQDITGMRDMLIHEYFGVDLEEVWQTATVDVPALKQIIEKHPLK
ncbi:MAG TPA: DUF86 domain-containing protein [Candidatus Paceibacterota bacterium]